MRFSLLLLTALLLLPACGDVLYLEASVPMACVTAYDQKIAAAPVAVPLAQTTRTSYKLDPALLNGAGSTTTLTLLSVTMAGREPTADFSFVDHGELGAVSGDAVTPVVAYRRTTTGQLKTLTFAPDAPADVTAALKKGEITLETTLTGTTPTRAFSADVTACFAVSARLGYAQ